MFTFEYRLYPTKNQEQLLDRMFASMMDTHNWALQTRKDYYEEHGKSLSWKKQSRMWSVERNSKEEYLQWSAGAQQEILKRVELSYVAFFRRLALGEDPGFPRFKTRNSFNSVTFITGKGGAVFYPSGSNHEERRPRKTNHTKETATINIMGIGHVKVREHRETLGNIKSMTVKRKRHKWFLTITTDYTPPVFEKTGREVGLDLGKRVLVATSDGDLIPAPRFLTLSLKDLQRAQQRLAACVGGSTAKRKAGEELSNTGKKCSRIVGNIHEKIRNQRNDDQNKIVHWLVSTYDVIYVEDLNIQNMIDGDAQYGEWAKSSENKNTYDASLGLLVQKLLCKAESAGKTVVLVDPSYTSQRCYACGFIDKDNRHEEKFKCLACGHEDHSDTNGSKNVLYKGAVGAFTGIPVQTL